MKIFKDIISNDELFSDTYPIKLVDDVAYEVTGKHVTTSEQITLDGANPSAEEAAEDCDAITQSGINIILTHRLSETNFGKKADYLAYLKGYLKKIDGNITEKCGDNARSIKANIQKYVKENIIHSDKFKNLQFFCGESNDPDAMISILDYKDFDGEEKPVMIFFKHGLEEEKV